MFLFSSFSQEAIIFFQWKMSISQMKPNEMVDFSNFGFQKLRKRLLYVYKQLIHYESLKIDHNNNTYTFCSSYTLSNFNLSTSVFKN